MIWHPPRQEGGPFERAAARICREAGATVAVNVRVRDLNVDAPSSHPSPAWAQHLALAEAG